MIAGRLARYPAKMLRLSALSVCLLALSCAGGQPALQAPIQNESAAAQVPAPVAAAPTNLPKGVWGDAPAACSSQVTQAQVRGAACKDARQSLARALHNTGAAADAELAALESCAEFPAGAIRALRAERLTPECRDLLIVHYAVPEGARSDVRDALFGLGISGQLRRLVKDPPTLSPPHDKVRVQAFVQGELARWIQTQAQGVFDLSTRGSALSGYAKGIVAIEAGMADMRFVEAARSAPVPQELRGDEELTEAYYATLDEALEPRKTRGRDAALVGLKQLAQIGVLRDERVLLARKLLSKLYAGRRIDALDGLLLPPGDDDQEGEQEVDEAIAEKLPSFYLPLLVPQLKGTDVAVLTALRHRSLPPFLRLQLDKQPADAAVQHIYALQLFELARIYWRAEDFARAAKVASALKGPRAELIAALSTILQNGPQDAAAMMLQGPLPPKGITLVAPLDEVVKSSPSLAGYAAYDAALLLETAPPPTASAAYFRDIAARYALAEKKLPPELRPLAKARRETAEATARAVK